MLKHLLDRWIDWVGDRSLERAIHAELRRQGYAVHVARIREPRLVAIERPGWVQVRRFRVETHAPDKRSVTLLGLSRDDGRRERIEVLLTVDVAEFDLRLDAWAEGLIRR